MVSGKIGLALGGGAARGWAHIGVIKTLLSAGITPSIVAGTSIGAVIGACYAADHLDTIEDFARDLTRRSVFGYLDFDFLGSGLITGQRLSNRLAQEFGDLLIEDLKVKFTAVATELGTGHEVWLSRGRLVDAVRASYALPGIFRPVKIDGRWLFDGALVNPIPVSVCRALGAHYVIAVNLNFDVYSRGSILPQLEPHPDPDAADAQVAALTDGGARRGGGRRNGLNVRKLLLRQIFGRGSGAPGISSVMIDAFNIVQDRIARSRLAGDPPDTLISCRLGDVGLFDFHRAGDLIRRGEAAAQRVLEEIKREIEQRESPGVQLVAR